MLNWFEFVLLISASFRLTRLIVYDTIIGFIRRPFHEMIEEELPDGTKETYLKIKGTGVRKWIGELISCYWCTGVWCSAFLYIGYLLWPLGFEPLIIIFAIAGVAALIEVVVEKFTE